MALMKNLNPKLYYNNPEQPKELAKKSRSNSHTSTLFHYTKTANTLLSIGNLSLLLVFHHTEQTAGKPVAHFPCKSPEAEPEAFYRSMVPLCGYTYFSSSCIITTL